MTRGEGPGFKGKQCDIAAIGRGRVWVGTRLVTVGPLGKVAVGAGAARVDQGARWRSSGVHDLLFGKIALGYERGVPKLGIKPGNLSGLPGFRVQDRREWTLRYRHGTA